MTRRTGATSAHNEGVTTPAALPFAVALGHRLRRVREDTGHTAADVAAMSRHFGLGWDRSTVARIELGRRQVTGAELLVLPLLYDRSLADLLPTEAARLGADVTATPEALRAVLTKVPARQGWNLPGVDRLAADVAAALTPEWAQRVDELARRLVPGADALEVGEAAADGLDDATAKAARRLGVPALRVAVAARRLWGRSLAAERDARVGPVGNARTRQARRGHVTRALLAELEPVIAQISLRDKGDDHHGQR